MSYKKDYMGYGFLPSESQHHFLVKIPKKINDKVIIFERFKWHEVKENEEQPIDFMYDIPKVELSKHKWKEIEDNLRIEFNERLKKEQIPVGRWKVGEVPVQRLLGKEMVLLTWAIEDSDPSVIPSAIKNWLGLSMEERWWLFTMTNAATGQANDKRGWRKAIRYALTENPIEENDRQMSFFDMSIDREIDK